MHRSAQGRQVALALYDNAQLPQNAGKSREDEVQSFSKAQNPAQRNQEIRPAWVQPRRDSFEFKRAYFARFFLAIIFSKIYLRIGIPPKKFRMTKNRANAKKALRDNSSDKKRTLKFAPLKKSYLKVFATHSPPKAGTPDGRSTATSHICQPP